MKNPLQKKHVGIVAIMLLISTTSPVFAIAANENIHQQPSDHPWWVWAKGAGGSSIDYGYSVATDRSGNTYVTGKFSGSAVFGTISLTGYGGWDIFVAKLNTNGEWQWAVAAGGSKQDGASSIAVDDQGNCYITGVFYDVAWFGNTSLTSIGGPADPDVFVAKLDRNGTWQWAVRGGGYVGDAGYGIAVDGSGNSYVTGHFMYSAYFGTFHLTSQGSADVFVAKLDTNGAWIWAVSGGGSQPDYVCDIAVDTNGNTYLTGDFEGSATFGTETITSLGNADVFIAKLDSTGAWAWARSGGSSSIERGYDIAVDGNNNAYVTGVFLLSITFGTTTLSSQGSWDVYVVKIDTNGDWHWAVRAGSSTTEGAWGIAVDSSGTPFISGVFDGVVTFGTTTIVPQGTRDVFVATLDPAGNWRWAISGGGTDWDEGYALSVDPNGYVYVTGYYDGSALFGNTTLTTQGDYDVFIAKLSHDGVNHPPVASFTWTPQNPKPTHQITFDASASVDTDGTITLYEWDWDNDGVYDESFSIPTVTHAWATSGSYPVTVRVTDDDHATGTQTKTVTVNGTVNLTIDITGGRGITAVIANTGTIDATDIQWTITLTGGFLLLGKTKTGAITTIQTGAEETIKNQPIFGIGKTTIMVEVTCDQGITTTQSATATIFLFFAIGVE